MWEGFASLQPKKKQFFKPNFFNLFQCPVFVQRSATVVPTKPHQLNLSHLLYCVVKYNTNYVWNQIAPIRSLLILFDHKQTLYSICLRCRIYWVYVERNACLCVYFACLRFKKKTRRSTVFAVLFCVRECICLEGRGRVGQHKFKYVRYIKYIKLLLLAKESCGVVFV